MRRTSQRSAISAAGRLSTGDPQKPRPHLRMNRIEAVFPLNCNFNKYPFDHCETTIWLLITIPPAANQALVSKAPREPATRNSPRGPTRRRRGHVATKHGSPSNLARHQVPRKHRAQREHARHRDRYEFAARR